MEAKIERMTGELKQAKIVAENAKSTWEKLRKERDFHKHHQDRVNGEKVTITSTIKTVKQFSLSSFWLPDTIQISDTENFPKTKCLDFE